MGLDRYSLRYKIKSVGGSKTILGRAGKDFYLACLISLIYLLMVYLNTYDINYWGNYTPGIAFVIGPVAAELAIINHISRTRQDVISNTAFNKKLDNRDYLVIVEFFYDYPNEIAHYSLAIWILFTIIWFISVQGFITILSSNFIAYIFFLPLFCLFYSLFTSYYASRATQIYKGLEIKYS